MSREQVMQSASEGGIAASHPPLESSAVLAGPATSREFNRIRGGIIPLACWRVEDIQFEFDSSFIKPEIAAEIQHLRVLREAHKKIDTVTKKTLFPPLSIFGHADPVGNDDYNKQLSGRRAAAIYGLLTRNTALWEELQTQPFGGDHWGTKALQTMQTVTGMPSSTPRRVLFQAYMDHICTLRDAQGQPVKFVLKPEDFLAQGIDGGGKGDYQGCGEFNPVLVFSQKENMEFAKPGMDIERNTANAPNRRVVVYLFRVGTRVDPVKWPCPRVKEGVAGCRRRFWSDGEKRRSFQTERREYKDTKDTFACRFYDRLFNSSPCELIKPGTLQRLLITLLDLEERPRPGVPYLLTVDGMEFDTVTNDAGQIDHFLPLASQQGTLFIEGQEYLININTLPPLNTLAGVQGRLNNLGFDCGSPTGTMNPDTKKALTHFQQQHGLKVTGDVTPETEEKLKSIYGH